MATKINYTQIQAEADLYKYSIVPSISSGNLTVALKNYLGQDPSITTPVKVQIGDTVRTITSALSDTFPAGTNWRNAGSSELATKEIDYFVYIGVDYLNNIRFCVSRLPGGNNQNDFSASGTYLNEKYLLDYTTSFKVTNIGRFSAILSAGPGYTWSTPSAGFQIINHYINETKWLDCNSIVSAEGSMTISNISINHFKYKIVGNNLFYKNNIQMDFGGTTNNFFTETLPFGRKLNNPFDIAGVGFGYDNSDIAPSVIFNSSNLNKLRLLKLTSNYAVINNANIRVKGNYEI